MHPWQNVTSNLKILTKLKNILISTIAWLNNPKLKITLLTVLITLPNFLRRKIKIKKQFNSIKLTLKLPSHKNKIKKIENWLTKPELHLQLLKQTKIWINTFKCLLTMTSKV